MCESTIIPNWVWNLACRMKNYWVDSTNRCSAMKLVGVMSWQLNAGFHMLALNFSATTSLDGTETGENFSSRGQPSYIYLHVLSISSFFSCTNFFINKKKSLYRNHHHSTHFIATSIYLCIPLSFVGTNIFVNTKSN